ncbi:hypothetical protein L6452_15744 [Arctium lappa]|uniref:Uncharacterized protein n=1 Tax=Arctium lappa TaxID=4217 RepID=A0ACB9CPQ2_ARCLA|nr:hypothetical protein L6452_15744 [Arctium lappa]
MLVRTNDEVRDGDGVTTVMATGVVGDGDGVPTVRNCHQIHSTQHKVEELSTTFVAGGLLHENSNEVLHGQSHQRQSNNGIRGLGLVHHRNPVDNGRLNQFTIFSDEETKEDFVDPPY